MHAATTSTCSRGVDVNTRGDEQTSLPQRAARRVSLSKVTPISPLDRDQRVPEQTSSIPKNSRLTLLRSHALDNEMGEIEMKERNSGNFRPIGRSPENHGPL
jgi:hypothetical protein